MYIVDEHPLSYKITFLEKRLIFVGPSSSGHGILCSQFWYYTYAFLQNVDILYFWFVGGYKI